MIFFFFFSFILFKTHSLLFFSSSLINNLVDQSFWSNVSYRNLFRCLSHIHESRHNNNNNYTFVSVDFQRLVQHQCFGASWLVLAMVWTVEIKERKKKKKQFGSVRNRLTRNTMHWWALAFSLNFLFVYLLFVYLCQSSNKFWNQAFAA